MESIWRGSQGHFRRGSYVGAFRAWPDVYHPCLYHGLFCVPVIRTTDKMPKVPLRFRRPLGSSTTANESTGLQDIWWFDPAPLPVGAQCYPCPSPWSWSLIFQEAATPAGLFQSGVCTHPWSGGVGGRARDISASPVRPQSTFLRPASSFQEHFLCIPEGSLRERHVNSFSFTWGLLETRKVL